MLKYYRFKDGKIEKVLFCMFLFAMLLLARDTMITSSILGFYKSVFVMYSAIGLLGIAFLVVNRKNLKQILLDRRMLLVLITTVVFVVPMLVKRDWQMLYFSILLCIYFAVFLSYFVSLKEVAKVYVVIISLLGVYSCIANYFLKALVETGLMEVPTFSNGVFNLYNFGLCYSLILPYPYYRNFGIFREPGVYQFFIIVALYLNNYIISWEKTKTLWTWNIILAITMLSTFATGGIIEMGLLAVVLFIDKKLYKNKKILMVAIVGVAAIIAVVIYAFVTQNLLYKTIYDIVAKLFINDTGSSGGVRYQSIWVDLQIFLQNPIFGEKLMSVMYAEGLVFNTTSTMILFAGYGICVGVLHTIAWIALVWQKDRKIWVNLALLLVLFMSFNTEDLTADIFFWLFPVMALVEKGLPMLDLKGNDL